MNNTVSLPGMMSPYFTGAAVGQTLPARDLPPGDYLIDDARYDYEGNWAFCVFDSDEAPAARFGFGRGMVDLSDYGGTLAPKSFLMLHIELMLRDGAALWLGTGRHQAAGVAIDPDRMANHLQAGGRTLFDIAGWPDMHWSMTSDDGEAGVEMDFALQTVTVLPDCIMPRNYFAMWLAIARASGELRVGDRRIAVAGAAFYDHPRVNVVRNQVAAQGWYLYTPVRLADGSHFAAYFARDIAGARIDYYSFGLLVDPAGTTTWFPQADLDILAFDADDKPARWTARYAAPGASLRLEAAVRGAAILRAWGGETVPQTRRDNGNIPLVFDARLEGDGDAPRLLNGVGMAEYVPHGETAWTKVK